jgi:hypothetical protein
MLLTAMVFVPAMRSPLARQVSLAVELDPVLALEVTERGFTFAGLEGTLSGSTSGKLIANNPNCSFARAAMFVDKVTVWVEVRVPPFARGTVSLNVTVPL